jgi:hypothetical protein
MSVRSQWPKRRFLFSEGVEYGLDDMNNFVGWWDQFEELLRVELWLLNRHDCKKTKIQWIQFDFSRFNNTQKTNRSTKSRKLHPKFFSDLFELKNKLRGIFKCKWEQLSYSKIETFCVTVAMMKITSSWEILIFYSLL